MTLKDKFVQILQYTTTNWTHTDAAECEKIAEDFAIGFADWKDENCFQATGTTLWYIPESDEFTSAYTNKQLLGIYKKEV